MRTGKRTAGFTLIELMVVVIIIAALAGMVLPRVLPATASAKAKISRGDIANITVALKLFKLHSDRYPTQAEWKSDSWWKTSTDPDWKEPYLDRSPKDPWKRKYEYRFPGTQNAGGFDLWSQGADPSGTGDDITNWEE